MQDQPRECSIRCWWWSGRQLLRMFQAACGWHHSRSPPQLQLSVHTAIWSVAIPLLTAAAIATVTSAAQLPPTALASPIAPGEPTTLATATVTAAASSASFTSLWAACQLEWT